MMKKKQYKNKKLKTKAKKNQNKPLINKKMSFGEILNRHPELAETLMKKGMNCIGCGMAMFETLEQGAIMHGINPNKLVEELNKKIKKR